jgi:DNA-directed RNA polymerase subunit RPC12/RpoP
MQEYVCSNPACGQTAYSAASLDSLIKNNLGNCDRCGSPLKVPELHEMKMKSTPVN